MLGRVWVWVWEVCRVRGRDASRTRDNHDLS